MASLIMLLFIGSVLLLKRRHIGAILTMWAACLYLISSMVPILLSSMTAATLGWYAIKLGWPAILIFLLGFPPTKRALAACERVA